MARVGLPAALLLCITATACAAAIPELAAFGHDLFRYPDWLAFRPCDLASPLAPTLQQDLSADPSDLYCVAANWLKSHMPPWDLFFLPPGVALDSPNMLHDTIAFFLLSHKYAKWMPDLERAGSAFSPNAHPLSPFLPYLLPYATYHEPRTNWRPAFFSRLFPLVMKTQSTDAAVSLLTSSDLMFLNWTTTNTYHWYSSSTPPVFSPADMQTYGYSSCTGFAVTLAYTLRSVGVPARVVGSPCWNTGEFSGLATANPNVTQCWTPPQGGAFLNNHNWVEFWSTQAGAWRFVNILPDPSGPNHAWFCGAYSEQAGCAPGSSAGRASRDHDIFAVTWSRPGEEAFGEQIIPADALRLSSGERVSPLVWSPSLASPGGHDLRFTGLLFVNRTSFYSAKA